MKKYTILLIFCFLNITFIKSQDFSLSAFDSVCFYWISNTPIDYIRVKITNENLFVAFRFDEYRLFDDSNAKKEIISIINKYIVDKTENIIDICGEQQYNADYDKLYIKAYKYGIIRYRDEFVFFEERKYNKGFIRLLDIFNSFMN